MAPAQRRAGAATVVVLLVAGVLLLSQSPNLTEPLTDGVVRRFLGAEKEQEHVTPEDKEPGDVKAEEKGHEKAESTKEEKPHENQTEDGSSVEDGGDEDGGAANGTAAEGMNATELAIHYDKVFDKIEGAEFLPPWFLVPILLLAKQMFTFLIFGFDMRFEHKDDPTGCWWYVTVLPTIFFRGIFQLFSCALVVNGYRSDWVEYRSAVEMLDAGAPGDGISTWESLALFIEVISTSGNFTAAAIVFVATLEQKYACGIPKYVSLPGALDTPVFAPFRFSVFPWIPFSTRWMPTVKHLYMYLLLPYTILPLVCNKVFTVIMSCIHFCVIAKVAYGFMCCLPLTLVTLTLVPYFYDCTAEFGSKLTPLWLQALLQCEGFFCVAFVGLAWLLFKCKLREIEKFDTAFMFIVATWQQQGEKNEINILQEYASEQADDTKEDFEWRAASQDKKLDGPLTGELLILMLVAHKSLLAVVYTQITVLTCMRTLMTGHIFASYAEVMLGRSWEGYTTHMHAQMQDGMTQATFLWEHREERMRDLSAALAVVSETVNAFWTA